VLPNDCPCSVLLNAAWEGVAANAATAANVKHAWRNEVRRFERQFFGVCIPYFP
jgi:hypothetical protein